jgi:vacuolar-type H+-ATPase subunit C/Vma6
MVEFAYAVGRIRAREAGMLDAGRIIRMVDAPDLAAAYHVLRELPTYLHEDEAFDFEKLLADELAETFALLENLSGGHETIRIIRRQHDTDLALSAYIKILSATAARYRLPLFRQYAASYATLQQIKLGLLAQKLDPETLLARFRYSDLKRPVTLGLEHYRQTGSLCGLEREIDNYLISQIQRARYLAFGLEPLIGHAIAKAIEIKIIRLILTAKRLHVSSEEIKERLRLPYV